MDEERKVQDILKDEQIQKIEDCDSVESSFLQCRQSSHWYVRNYNILHLLLRNANQVLG